MGKRVTTKAACDFCGHDFLRHFNHGGPCVDCREKQCQVYIFPEHKSSQSS